MLDLSHFVNDIGRMLAGGYYKEAEAMVQDDRRATAFPLLEALRRLGHGRKDAAGDCQEWGLYRGECPGCAALHAAGKLSPPPQLHPRHAKTSE